MNIVLFTLGATPVTMIEAAAAAVLCLLALIAFALLRGGRDRALEAAAAAERQRELDEKIAQLNAASDELRGHVRASTEALGTRQSDLARLVSERLDAVGGRVGQGIEQAARGTQDHLAKLNERLAVIDAAQAGLTSLTQEVVGLKDILSNKQARGAYGQGRMEAIVRDGLPAGTYEMQYTLSNRMRPDCIIRLPGDDRVMVLDAKFPLESFTLLKSADTPALRKTAEARVRGDVGQHVDAIATKYFVPGETQDIAVLFVPSESIYADLAEYFDDVVQKAHRARIIIVSPSLLMMAIQVMQAIVRDARVREQAQAIHDETRKLTDDVRRLRDRVGKLDAHFRQAQDDVATIVTSSDKIVRRGERIDTMDFPADAPGSPTRLGQAAE